MRIAWFSSWNSKGPPTQAQYFTQCVLPSFLRDGIDSIEVFTDSFGVSCGVPTFHYLQGFERHREDPFDIFFYQVEDGVRSHFVRHALGLFPGVTLFHDYILTDLGPDPLTNSPWEVTAGLLEDRSRPVSFPARTVEFPRVGPIAHRELSLSVIKIFHGDGGEFFDSKSFFLPRAVPLMPPACKGTGSLVTPSHKPIRIGFVGSPRIEHRAHLLCEALRGADFSYEVTWLVASTEIAEAQALAEEYGVTNLTILPERSPEVWQRLLADVDIAVHTLFSVYGSTGVYALLSLAARRPIVVTDFASGAEFPDEVAWKVRPGIDEALEIRGVLERFADRQISWVNEVGRRYVEENHDAAMVGEELRVIFERSRVPLREAWGRWQEIMDEARRGLVSEQPVRELTSLLSRCGW